MEYFQNKIDGGVTKITQLYPTFQICKSILKKVFCHQMKVRSTLEVISFNVLQPRNMSSFQQRNMSGFQQRNMSSFSSKQFQLTIEHSVSASWKPVTVLSSSFVSDGCPNTNAPRQDWQRLHFPFL